MHCRNQSHASKSMLSSVGGDNPPVVATIKRAVRQWLQSWFAKPLFLSSTNPNAARISFF